MAQILINLNVVPHNTAAYNDEYLLCAIYNAIILANAKEYARNLHVGIVHSSSTWARHAFHVPRQREKERFLCCETKVTV